MSYMSLQPCKLTVARRTDGMVVISSFGEKESWSNTSFELNDAALHWLVHQLVLVSAGTITEVPPVQPSGLEHMKKHYPASYRAFVLDAPPTGSEE